MHKQHYQTLTSIPNEKSQQTWNGRELSNLMKCIYKKYSTNIFNSKGIDCFSPPRNEKEDKDVCSHHIYSTSF